MPFVSYFAARVKNFEITASDATDLFLTSTITHTPGGKGAPPVPMAHPPHAQAHIAKEGFQGTNFAPLTVKEQTRRVNLMANKARTREQDTELQSLNDRHNKVSAFGKEGMHIDPATRDTYADPMQTVVDPVKKGAANPYTKRPLHSQFQDSEIAIVALYHALNTKAGAEALGYLNKTPGGRAVITSLTAAEALNMGPLKLKNAPKKLSPHPDRGKTAEVVLRGTGASGVAAPAIHNKVVLPATAKMEAIISVLDHQAGGQLVLTTHYPSHTKPDVLAIDAKGNFLTKLSKAGKPITYSVQAADDYVEMKDTAVAKLVTYHKVQKFAPTAFKAAPPVTWSTKRPTILRCAVSSAGLTCVICASVHGATPSLFNKWFQCSRCGSTYCAVHSTKMVVAKVKANEPPGKVCQNPNCANGVARWIF